MTSSNPRVDARAHRAVRILGLAVLVVLAYSFPSSAANVTLSSPADGALLSALNVSFSYATDLNATSCALYANASGWASVASTAGTAALSHVFGSDAQYLWAIACTDGNQMAFSENRSVRIDTAAPSVPGNLSAFGHTPVNLSWNSSSDASSVTYELWRNVTSLVYSGSGLSFSENVPASTTYNYSVRAVDAAGWASANASVLVNGPAPSLSLSNFTVSPSASGATFSWIPSVAANASVSYGNTTAVMGIVANPSLSSSTSLAVAGLQPATSYFYNATACAATCTTVSGTFRTLPSSYPSPSQVFANGSAAGSFVRFSAYWTDALNLSYYVFSTNASGTWANTSYAFNGSYSNHSLTLPSTAVTVAWLFYANNSQNAQNATALQSLAVIVPTGTPTPTATPTATPAPTVLATSTPLPTIPPELVTATAAPEPTPAPTPDVVPAGPAPAASAPASITATLAGIMGDLVLDVANADFALSPTGLVVGVNAPKADVVLSSNFTNQGDELTIQLEVDFNGSSGAIQLSSQPTTVETGRMQMLETAPQAVTPGEYDVVGKIVAVDSGQVLDQKSLKLRVASTYAPSSDTPALSGFLVVLLAVSAVLAGQLNSVKKEFA